MLLHTATSLLVRRGIDLTERHNFYISQIHFEKTADSACGEKLPRYQNFIKRAENNFFCNIPVLNEYFPNMN